MNKLKKSLSVLLTLVMLFTTFCFFPLDLGAIEADAAVAGIKIVVPETLYLTPSTGASTSIQYYINNNADGSLSASQDTSAKVHITYPGAKLTSVSAKTSAAITLPASITGLVGTTFGSSATTATGTFSLPAGLNAGGTALVEWTFVFDVNGKTQTHFAYSVAYAPWYQPVGAAARAVGSHHNVYSSSILWVTGVHGYVTGDSANLHYPKTDTFMPINGTIQAPSNTGPDTYIQSGSNGLSATITYHSISEYLTNYHARANSISPTANLTVDTSRYNNLNQIPNLKFGFMVTDRENAEQGTWYLSDYGTNNGSSYYNGTARSGSRYDGDYDDAGTKLLEGSDIKCAVKYNGAWDKAVTGTTNYRIKSAVYGYHGGGIKSTSWNNNFVNLSVTGANKGSLRTNVLNGTSYAKENYTADTWDTYYSALKTAATNLGNPTSATVDTSALTTAEAGLKTTVYLDAKGGSLSTTSFVVTIGGNSTASANVASYVPTRTGYTFKGWATSSTATSGSTSNVTVGFNQTLYAVWQANTYNVVFDNMFDFNAFNITGSLDINERTETGFTATSTAEDGNTGFSAAMPVEPGKTYVFKADVQLEAVSGGYDMYVHTLDSNQAGETTAVPDTTNGAHREGNVYISLTGQTTNTTPYIRFTAGVNTAFIKIRFDANAVGNKLTVNNIRVYEVGTVADGVSYEAPYAATYDSTYALPTPTRENYAFAGWFTADGIQYASGDTVKITDTLHLYSDWTDANYFIAFDANSGEGSMETVKANIGENYVLPANTFTKTGYKFVGWALDKNASSATYGDKAGVQLTNTVSTVTLYAVWTEDDFTITFDTDGGSAVAPITQKYNSAVTAPVAPTKTGYTFAGWDTVIPSTMPAENMTIKAKWNINQYTITFNSNGGSAVAPITQDYGSTVTAPTAPTKTGYTFDGWDNLPATMPAENITVNAKWKANDYTIDYDTVGGSAVASTPAVYDAEATLAAAPTKTGYVFKGWKLGDTTYEAGATVKNLAAEGSVTVTAVWEANTYTVTFDKNDDAATGTMGDQSFTYDEAENLDALDFTKEGWHFVEWNTAADGKGTSYADKAEAVNLTADVDGKVTLYAIWTINLYDVTFKFYSVTGEEKTVTRNDIPHGTAFSALALPTADEGYAATYYNGAVAEPENNTHHYNFTAWENAVDEITAEVTFVAKYEAEEHKFFDNGSVPAECGKPGLDKKACDCGFTYEKATAALEHDWKETSRVVDCINGDTVDYKCSLCQGTKRETLAATGHTFSAVTEKKAPTCTDTGLKAYKTCEKCKLYFAETADNMEAGATDLSGFVIPAAGHDYGELIAIKEATCEDTGVIAHYKCSVCLKTFDADKNEVTDLVITAKGHNYGEWIDEIPADCENNGTLGHYNCSVCGKNFDSEKAVLDSLVIPALEHDLETVPGQIPTCENIGWAEYQRCTREGCNYSTYVEIPATDHAYSGTVKTPATCTADGVMTYTCSNDASHTYEEAIKAQGHKFINNVAYKAPECLVDGNEAYKQCSVCNKYFAAAEEAFSDAAHDSTADFVIDMTGHTEATKQEIITTATCQVKGDYKIITYCSVCNVTIKTEEFSGEFLPHDYSVETKNYLRTAATCVDYATYYLACSMCDKSSEDDGDAYYEDEAAGYNPANHTTNETHIVDYKDSTCYEAGYTGDKLYNCCDALFEKGTEIAKKAHTPAEAVEENRVEATCYSEGSYDEVVYCSVCKAAGKTEVLSRETQTIEKVDHTPAAAVVENKIPATCYAEGSYDEVVYCSVCKAAGKTEVLSRETKIIEKVDHTPAAAVVENKVPATCYVEGSYDEVVYCSVCKAAGKTEELSRVAKTIEKADHTAAAPVVENKNDSTCYAEGSYDEVVYCSVCSAADKTEVLSRETKIIEKKEHTRGEAVNENVVPATCYAEGSYDEVIYCSVCEAAGKTEELSRETKTIAKIAHTPATAVRENVKNATCATEGSYDEVVYCSVEACNYEISRTEKEIATVPHNPGEKVIENKVPATSSKDGSYDEVTYCTFCGTETSREKKTYTAASVLPGLPEDGKVNVDLGENGESDKTLDEILGADGNDYDSSNPDITVDENGNITADKDGETVITVTTPDGEIIEVPVTVRTVKTITFIMKDKTEKVNAYNGDTVALPDVADYTAADGFIHKFKNWDKPVAVVNGDATYTAVYTEPADWSVLDDLEDTLNEILDGGLVEDSILEENKAKIETVLNQIENINKDRNTLDKSEQSRVDFVAGEIGGLLDVIYPDAGSTLVIEGASTAYAGTILDLKAVKMPLGAVLTDAQWTSSDEKVVFFSNGKLYAIGTGTVTLTAKRGILEAKKTITIVEGGNTRGINFTSINNTHFIIEDYAAVYNSAIIYWSDDFDLRFRVRVYQSFMFDDYIVYINGQEAQPNAEGYFVVPAGSGDVRVTIAGAMIDTGAGEGETVTKWSFWEWLLNFFRKIIAFFQDLFGIN